MRITYTYKLVILGIICNMELTIMICLNDSKTVASQCTIAQCPKQHLLIGIYTVDSF